jgi:signal transduction histidine kinase
MKAMPLRIKVTLLCALIIAVIAAGLTAASVFNVDRFFVQDAYQSMPITDFSTYSTQVEQMPADSVQIGESFEVKASVSSEQLQDSNNSISGDIGLLTITTTQRKKSFTSSSLVFMMLLTLLGSFAVYWITGRALKPVKALADNIHTIDENNLSLRLDKKTTSTEIAQLTDSFNHMLDKLDKAFFLQKHFAQAAAHELKTPLACVRTNIEVLQIDDAPSIEEYQQTLDIVLRNTDRLIDLVDDLLHMNTQESGQSAPICASNVVERILEELQPQITEKKLTIHCDCQGSICANELLFYRMAANLIENAVKYTPSGGEITITSSSMTTDFSFQIANTSPPVSEEDLSHIFEPFYRIDKSRSRDTAGSGLGLALVRDIVQKYGGTIHAEYQENRLVFSVSLPQLPRFPA